MQLQKIASGSAEISAAEMERTDSARASHARVSIYSTPEERQRRVVKAAPSGRRHIRGVSGNKAHSPHKAATTHASPCLLMHTEGQERGAATAAFSCRHSRLPAGFSSGKK